MSAIGRALRVVDLRRTMPVKAYTRSGGNLVVRIDEQAGHRARVWSSDRLANVRLLLDTHVLPNKTLQKLPAALPC